MSRVLGNDRQRVARKKDQCFYCGEGIFIGDRYLYRVGVSGGDFWSMKMHHECDKYAAANLTADDYEFYECPMFDRPKTNPEPIKSP